MSKRIAILFAVAVTFSVALAGIPRAGQAQAQKISLIRDAEIENIIRAYSTPLWQAAGLEPSAIKVLLVNDNSLNAFVAGGQNLFLNTGLLIRAESASQVIGVIAHETGHIAGGHITRLHDAVSDASIKSVVAMLLGAAAGIASGRGDIGQAVAMGGAQLGQRELMSFSRTQEGEADQAALKLLNATQQSARGLQEFFNILGDQELVGARYQDPYARTHPLTRDRIDDVEHFVERSPFSDKPTSAEFNEMHKRMRAKLVGFMEPFQTALRRYPERDTRPEARYARAIAYYRKAELATALPLIDGLIAEAPGDPYYLELKGQMLFENGRVAESVPPYQESVQQLPSSGLLRLGLARAQIEAGRDDLLDDAIDNLRAALRSESGSAFMWRQLAIVYGRQGNEAESGLARGEEALLLGKPQEALYHAKRAESMMPRGSPSWLQAQDIVNAAQQLKDRQARDRSWRPESKE